MGGKVRSKSPFSFAGLHGLDQKDQTESVQKLEKFQPQIWMVQQAFFEHYELLLTDA